MFVIACLYTYLNTVGRRLLVVRNLVSKQLGNVGITKPFPIPSSWLVRLGLNPKTQTKNPVAYGPKH